MLGEKSLTWRSSLFLRREVRTVLTTSSQLSASHFKRYWGSDKCRAVFRSIDDLPACFCMGRYLCLEPICRLLCRLRGCDVALASPMRHIQVYPRKIWNHTDPPTPLQPTLTESCQPQLAQDAGQWQKKTTPLTSFRKRKGFVLMPCVAYWTARSSEASLNLFALCAPSTYWTYKEINDARCENRQKNEHTRKRGENDDEGERIYGEDTK